MKEKSEYNIRFGRRLAALRALKSLSQEELAFKCDINRTYIGTIERGEKSATVNTIYKLAHGLGVKPAEFFAE